MIEEFEKMLDQIDKNSIENFELSERVKKIEDVVITKSMEDLAEQIDKEIEEDKVDGFVRVPVEYDPRIIEAMRGPRCECGEPITLTNLMPKYNSNEMPCCPKCKKEYNLDCDDSCEYCGASKDGVGSFMWAVEQMKDGKKVRRATWIEPKFIYSKNIENEVEFFTDGIFDDVGDEVDWLGMYIFLATDWEIFEDIVEEEVEKVNIFGDFEASKYGWIECNVYKYSNFIIHSESFDDLQKALNRAMEIKNE